MRSLATKVGAALVVILLTFGATWKVQDWRYGKQLAEQAELHQDDLTAISNAAAAQVRADQDKRLALEQRLAASDETHYKGLSDAQTNQARLRGRLANADLRLSVLIDAADSTSGCAVPTDTGAGDGDQELIALAACQAYIREVSR